MRIDNERLMPLAKGLAASLGGGGVVLDLGCGSGVLSVLACAAGADRVYAVECDSVVLELAIELVRRAGCSDKVVFIHADAKNVELPESVDVAIVEMLHAWLVEEQQVPAVRNAKCYLKPGGSVLPAEVSNWAELVEVRSVSGVLAPLPTPIHIEPGDQIEIRPLTRRVATHRWIWSDEQESVDTRVDMIAVAKGVAHGVRLTSAAIVREQVELARTPTIFNDVVVPIRPRPIVPGVVPLQIKYDFGCRWDELCLVLGANSG